MADVIKKETIVTETTKVTIGKEHKKSWKDMAPKKQGVLDMVIAFDTTGSMAAYIEDVRKQVAELIPRLFNPNRSLEKKLIIF